MTTEQVKGYLDKYCDGTLVQDYIRYGIEVEFSELGELQEYGYPEPTEDDAVESLEEEDRVELLVECWQRTAAVRQDLSTSQLRIVAEIVVRNWGGDLESLVNECTNASYSGLINDRLNALLENWEGEDTYQEIYGWHNSQDATRGIKREYKTSFPVTMEDMQDRLSTLFHRAGSEAEVPLNGSAHVHVSFPGCRHSATEQSTLHCCILYELAVQLKDTVLPEELLERWKEHENYFRFSAPPGEKFSCVHMHPQGTWEFRLWGGLASVSPLLDCVEISGLAIVRGYRRFLAGNYAICCASTFRKSFAAFMQSLIGYRSLEHSSIPELPNIGVNCPLFNIACGSVPFINAAHFDVFQEVSLIPHNNLG